MIDKEQFMRPALIDAVDSVNNILEDYIDSSGLETALADYVDSSDLETALADYVTDTELNTELNDYVTSSTLTDDLKLFKRVLITASTTENISANNAGTISSSWTCPTGYTPLLAAFIHSNNHNTYLVPTNISYTNSTYSITIRNLSGSASAAEVKFYMICIKSGSLT